MKEPTPRRRLAGRLLIGAAALALPLTASITYAASEPEAPAAAVAPEAPAAPAAPATPEVKVEKRIIVVDHPGAVMSLDGKVDDKKLHTKVIERDGKTIILKSAEPLSEAEAAARVAKAEASMAQAEAMASREEAESRRKMVIVQKLDHDRDAKTAGEVHRAHSIVLADAGGEWAAKGDHPRHVTIACEGGNFSEAHAVADKDGKKQVVKVKICSKGAVTAKALEGLRKARERIADDSKLTGEVREEVLRELDAEIARLSKEG